MKRISEQAIIEKIKQREIFLELSRVVLSVSKLKNMNLLYVLPHTTAGIYNQISRDIVYSPRKSVIMRKILLQVILSSSRRSL